MAFSVASFETAAVGAVCACGVSTEGAEAVFSGVQYARRAENIV
jgi:hypothetical protein